MNVAVALQQATKQLESQDIPTASLDAEVVLCFVLNIDRAHVLADQKRELTKAEEKKYSKLIDRRAEHEPVAYLVGHKEFYGRDFLVTQQTFIPRPDTEVLIDEVKKLVGTKNVTIADIGTGSGCIAVTLALELPQANVYAVELSKRTLTVAKENAKRLGANVEFFNGSLTKPLEGKKIDVMVTNLPYGWPEWENNATALTKGLKYEPRRALFAKNNGLYLYQKLFRQIAKTRHKPKIIIGEFDPRQEKQLVADVKKIVPEYRATIKKDLAGLERLLVLQLSNH